MVAELSCEAFHAEMARREREGDLPDWAVDRQKRARASRERLLKAAHSLMTERGDASFSMEDLAAHADLSVGALYARFPSKAAVIGMLGLAIMESGRLEIEREVDRPSTAAGLLRAYVATLVRLFRRHRATLRVLRAARASYPELVRLIASSNTRIHRFVGERLQDRLPTVPAERIEMALFVSSAAVREAVLYDALATYGTSPDDGALAKQISDLASAYLGVEES